MTWHVIYIEEESGIRKWECGHRPVGEIGAYAPEGSGKWKFGIGKWEFGIGKWECGMRKWKFGIGKWEVEIRNWGSLGP
jgi:hypothetical protein